MDNKAMKISPADLFLPEVESGGTDHRVRLVVPVGGRRSGEFILEEILNDSMPGLGYIGKRRFPGGGVEPGETPRMAIVREIREETGVEIDGTELSYVGHVPYVKWGIQEHLFVAESVDWLAPGDYADERGRAVRLVVGEIDLDNWLGGDPTPLLLAYMPLPT